MPFPSRPYVEKYPGGGPHPCQPTPPLSPATVSLNGGGTETFTGATLTYDGSNSGVTWSISPATGAGTIVNTTGAYTAPAVVSGTSPVTVTVTATSVKDSTKTATATITLNPIAISFTTATTGITLDSGQTLALAAAVANDASASGATFAATGAGTVNPSSAAGNTPATTLTATGLVASTVTVTATSIKDTTKSATTASITVNPALAFTTAPGALTAGTTNTAYAGATIAISGGTGNKTFAIATGALPTGLTINTSTGAISGTPTGTAGTATFTVKVTDTATTPASVTSGSYTITISAAPLVWVSPTTGTVTYTVGTPITPITLTTNGGTGAITYTLNSGTLPAGLSISGNTLSGTPTAPTVVAGNVVTFKATDSASTPVTAISSNVTIIVNPVTLVVNTPILPVGTVAATYSYQFTHTGDTDTTVTWTMSPSTIDGLTLSSTGLLSGTPTATYGPATISVTATDSATNQQQTKTITPSLTVNNALTITTTQGSLPYAYTGTGYNTTLVAAGGTGPYTWSVTSGLTGSNSLATLNLVVNSSTGAITGTPTATGTATFTVKVTDSLSHTATATYTINAFTPLSLPTPSSTVPGPATITASYTGSIVAIGGVGPNYTWTVNGSTGAVSLGNGTMQASSNGGYSLDISGQPTNTGTITLIVSVRDNAGTTVGPITYTIAVSTNYSVGGQINLTNSCNVATQPGYSLTLTQGSNTIGTATSDNNGNFTITNVPNGTYTLTPSITGPSSVFYPATQSVTVNNANITNAAFGVNLGYTVSGTASYTGSVTQAKPIYLSLNNTSCGGGGTEGTSIVAAGSYSIRGVPPGTYTLSAFQDNLGYGAANTSNPSGSTANETVSTANVTSANVTLTNPSTVTLTSAPKLQGVSAVNNGALAMYKPITNSNGVEMATSYTLQWSTSSTFSGTITGSQTFQATGSGGANIWLLNTANTTTCTNCSTLASGAYYFRTYGTSAGTATSPYSSVVGPITMGAPAGGVAVSGAVTYTGTATGPMYVGFYDLNTNAFYGEYIASPSSAAAYTVQVPTGSYYFVSIIDNNKDGIVDVGDFSNVNSGNDPPTVDITAATANEDLTLSGASSSTKVTTQVSSSPGNSNSYSLQFQVRGLVKLPVAVTLTSSTNADGANVPAPTDIAVCSGGNNSCGKGFQIGFNLNTTSPSVGDTYNFGITYSDGTPGTATATVTAVLNAFATLVSPTVTSSSLQPTFTWTDPAVNASDYTYQFQLSPRIQTQSGRYPVITPTPTA